MKKQNLKSNDFDVDFIDDKVVFNTILLPVVFYVTGWNFGAVASMIFFTIAYFLIPIWYKDDKELAYKFRSFLFIFAMGYIPVFTVLFLEFF
jgi:hypothetical protein